MLLHIQGENLSLPIASYGIYTAFIDLLSYSYDRTLDGHCNHERR